MPKHDHTTQRIYFEDSNIDINNVSRKQSRIELRALKDAYALKIEADHGIPKENSLPEVDLRRVTSYCTAENYDFKQLTKYLKKSEIASKVVVFFGECLYASIKFDTKACDCFFYDYGVLVAWGMNERQETEVLKFLEKFELKKYSPAYVEKECFQYGVTEDPFIINDVIYLNSEYHITKMVISTAIAQSVKLDYFENLVDATIDIVKDLPNEIENEGKVSKTRKQLLKIIGKLHTLKFSLNLGSNILDKPEFVWEYSAFSSVYETCRKYLDIKSRADLLNKRMDVIHGILDILSENINTNNSERLEKVMIFMIFANVIIGIIQTITYFCLHKN